MQLLNSLILSKVMVANHNLFIKYKVLVHNHDLLLFFIRLMVLVCFPFLVVWSCCSKRLMFFRWTCTFKPWLHRKVHSNAPFLLNLDYDHYINNSKTIREALRFHHGAIIRKKGLLCSVLAEIWWFWQQWPTAFFYARSFFSHSQNLLIFVIFLLNGNYN